MRCRSLCITLSFLIVFSSLCTYALTSDDPFKQEKQKVLDLVVKNVLKGKMDDVEILINDIPEDPSLPVALADLDAPVKQPAGWAWLVVIDDQPGAYWKHQARWVFVDRTATRIILVLDKESLPRLTMNGVKRDFDIMLKHIARPKPVPKRTLPDNIPAPNNYLTDYHYDNYYAVIIQGDVPSGDSFNEFWLDNVIMYQTLIEYGYAPENIYVLYGNGADETGFPCDWYLETMVDFPAYQQDVRNIFTWMKDGNPSLGIPQVTPNDFIYLYTFDHGGSNGECNAALCLMDGCMPDTEFASYFNAIPYMHRVVVMQQCFSGGFIDNLQNDTTVQLMAANCYESAWQGDESEECNGHTMHHGEFNYWYMSAMRGHKPKPGEEAVNQDRNGDGKVSFYEAFQYTIENDSQNENPQYSDPGNLGNDLSLQTWDPDGAALFYKSHIIDDSTGNNDGISDAGESIILPVTLKNSGAVGATLVSATLSTTSSSVTITDGYAEYPDIASDSYQTSLSNHYAWRSAPSTPPGTTARFRIDWTSNGGIYSGSTLFSQKITSVSLAMDHHEIDDSSSSNPDGAADAGESVNMPVTLKNSGDGTAHDLSGTLTTTSSYVTITDGTDDFPDIPGGATVRSNSPHFAFTIDANCPEGAWIDFNIHMTGALNYIKDLALRVLVGSRGQILIIEDGSSVSSNIFQQVLSDRAYEIVRTTAAAYNCDTWHDYNFIVWSSGTNSYPAGNTTYRTDLENFVSAGGHLLIEGGELGCLHDTENPSFAHNVLHIDSWIAHNGYTMELNDTDHPISFFPHALPSSLMHTYTPYGEDICTVSSDATAVYDWSSYPDKGGVIAFDDDASSSNGGQIVFFTFAIDSVDNGGVARDDLIENSASWLANSYKIRYQSHTIDDSDPNYGNGNGIVDPREIVTFSLTLANDTVSTATAVSAVLASSTPGVTIHTNYATFPDIPGSGTGTSQSPNFSFSTNASCGSRIVFSLTVHHDHGLSSIVSFSLPVGDRQYHVFFNDDMEASGGWTTASSEGAEGLWVLADPYGVTNDLSETVQPENDTTPDPGVKCWVTGNPRPTGKFKPQDGDVDGIVTLDAPLFSTANGEDIILRYQRFFYYKSSGIDDSTFSVAYSTNGGTSWNNLETLTTNLNTWSLTEYPIKAISSEMKLRFQASEDGGTIGDMILEGLIDDVKVDGYRWFCSSFTLPPADPPNPVGNTLRLSRMESGTKLEWLAPPSDATHDPATFYRVYRSARPDADFIELGAPTSTFYLDSGSAGSISYYYIKAENGGGSE